MSGCPTNYLCTEPACREVCTNSLSTTENICLKCDSTVTDKQFNDAWQGGQCQSTIASQYYEGGGITEAQKRVNRVLEFMMGSDGSQLVANGTDESQNSVLTMCQGYFSQTPGACDNYILNRLANNDRYNYDMMATNVGVANWLGCFIPPPSDEVTVYNSLESSVTEVCQKSVGATPCYPMCHRISTIQRYAPCYTEVCRCDPNVCVIDDVSVNGSSDSSIGNVGITQICPQCTGDTSCVCIISSNSLQQTIGDAGISTSFNQYCGQGGVCYQIEDGILVQVDCQDYLGQPSNPATDISIPIIVFIVGGILFLIALLAMLATRKTVAREEPKSTPKPQRGAISYDKLDDL